MKKLSKVQANLLDMLDMFSGVLIQDKTTSKFLRQSRDGFMPRRVNKLTVFALQRAGLLRLEGEAELTATWSIVPLFERVQPMPTALLPKALAASMADYYQTMREVTHA